MAASPMAETTGVAVRGLHAAGRERPGNAGLGAEAADTHAGRRRAGPVWAGGGRRPRPVVTHSSTAPWYLRLTRRLSCVFARILRSLMHTLLSWQLKKPQTGTS